MGFTQKFYNATAAERAVIVSGEGMQLCVLVLPCALDEALLIHRRCKVLESIVTKTLRNGYGPMNSPPSVPMYPHLNLGLLPLELCSCMNE